MKKSRILSAITVAAVAASAIAASAATASAEGTYHAYLGIQSASYTFRNAWSEPNYGGATEYFDHLTGWDGPDATNNGGTFTDAEITGDGTYKVSLTGDFDFGSDETLNLLFISTDIPLDAGVAITDVNVYIDGQKKYTFDDAYLADDITDYYQPQCINIWNDDLGKADGLFGYMMPTDSVELEFTISGLGAGAAEEAPAEEAAEETATEEAAPVSDDVTTPATTGNATAGAIAGAMAVAAAAAIVAKKRK